MKTLCYTLLAALTLFLVIVSMNYALDDNPFMAAFALADAMIFAGIWSFIDYHS